MQRIDPQSPRLRLRPDLVVRPQESRSGYLWIVKDPITLQYYLFRAEEYAILQMLDGTRGFNEICDQFESLFPPLRMTTAKLQDFLANLHRNELLICDGVGQGDQLLEKADEQRTESRRSWFDILAIQFRGIDPEPFLSWLAPRVGWLYSPWFLGGYVLLVMSALLVLFAEGQEFRAQLPNLGEFLSPRNMIWLAAVLAAAKIVHELAHAVTCRHFGGECHEMGLMLLVFTPCLYCNVTDSWMLRSRAQRMVISAAGILAEVGLASLAVFGWWFTHPGLLHTICLNAILVCGVSTVLFNANPLLRYDGYFILSDLLAIPNLWQESRSVIHHTVTNWIFAINEIAPPKRDRRIAVLAIYGVSSMCYRAFVAVAIVLFLYRWLQPTGLGIIAQFAAASLIIGMATNWTRLLRNGVKSGPYRRTERTLRFVTVTALIAAAVAAIFYIPFPYRVAAPALIDPAGAHRIYISTPGRLNSAVSAGDRVAAGQVLAHLEDASLRLELADRRAEYERASTRVRHLEVRASIDAAAAADLVVAREVYADAKQRLDKRLREERGLTLASPISGTVIAPPKVRRGSIEPQLSAWCGTPLDPLNQLCFLERGTLFCLVGDPARQEALVYVDGADIALVRPGQPVRLKFDVGPTVLLTGRVVEVAQGIVSVVPTEFVADNEIASRADDEGNVRPIRPIYQVRVALDGAHATELIAGSRGRAKIEVVPQTLSQRMLRSLRQALTIEI